MAMLRESLNSLDAVFLELEQLDDGALMHTGAALLFDPRTDGGAPSHQELLALLEERLGMLPRSAALNATSPPIQQDWHMVERMGRREPITVSIRRLDGHPGAAGLPWLRGARGVVVRADDSVAPAGPTALIYP